MPAPWPSGSRPTSAGVRSGSRRPSCARGGGRVRRRRRGAEAAASWRPSRWPRPCWLLPTSGGAGTAFYLQPAAREQAGAAGAGLREVEVLLRPGRGRSRATIRRSGRRQPPRPQPVGCWADLDRRERTGRAVQLAPAGGPGGLDAAERDRDLRTLVDIRSRQGRRPGRLGHRRGLRDGVPRCGARPRRR